MAVAFRAAAHNSTASGTLTINVPTGTVDGDIMIATILVSGASGTATNASWTALDTGSVGPTLKTFYRVASSEPASYNFAVSASAMGSIVSYSGGDTTTPINQHGTPNRLTSTTATATTITPSVDGCMLVWVGGAGVNSVYTGPSGYTQRDTLVTSLSVIVADLLQVSQAATGSVSATTSPGGNNYASLIAVAPVGGGVTVVRDRRSRGFG